MNYPKTSLIIFFLLFTSFGISQETLPVYSDYLSDNIFLVHPAAAGIGDSAKLRVTAQQQWLGVENAPSFQTLSYNSYLGQRAGAGLIFYNDSNGYSSQLGIQGAYAYHLNLGGRRFNQLSLGFGVGVKQNSFDTASFFGNPNASFSNDVTTKRGYFNLDLSLAYYYHAFYTYLTAKNIFVSDINRDDILFEKENLRNYLFNAGYYFGENRYIQFEPSVMIKYFERTNQTFLDLNFKVYKPLKKSLVWAAVSYRRSFGKTENLAELRYFSPIIGANLGRTVVAYTYTQQISDLVVDRSGFHQITIGFNLFYKRNRASSCPNPNIKMPFYY
jgi:type IX secretion system PorP/SprF family membrane protein